MKANQYNINVFKATILEQSHGPDKVFLHTDLPCPFVKDFLASQPPLDLTFECTANTGKKYVECWFKDVPIEIITI